jgi:hypothetical protein
MLSEYGMKYSLQACFFKEDGKKFTDIRKCFMRQYRRWSDLRQCGRTAFRNRKQQRDCVGHHSEEFVRGLKINVVPVDAIKADGGLQEQLLSL